VSLPVPTGRAAILVAVSSLTFVFWRGTDWTAFLVVAAAVVAVVGVDAVRCTSPRAVTVERHAPDLMVVGETGEMSWTVGNTSRRVLRLTVADALWPSLQPSRRRFDVRLDPGRRVAARATLAPTRRGRFPLDDVTVRVRSPLGLVVRHGTRRVPGAVRVHPGFPSRDDVAVRLRQVRVVDAAVQAMRLRGGDTDFDQLRDYTPDDSFRRIDWAATARVRRPIVRDYRIERNQSVVVLLDNGRTMAGTVGGVPRVEHAMDAVFAITAAATDQGDRVGLVAFDTQVRSIVVPSASRTQRSRMAEAMFQLEPHLAESAFADAFAHAVGRFRRRSLYIVLTDLSEATVHESILPALPVLTRRHLVLVAAVQDPVVAAWARGQHTSDGAGAVFRSAAAISAAEQRHRSAARLRAAGAVVLDAEPGRLGLDLVDAYLSLKAAGRL
jgi:uncharacterized protein (DUF58 family)